MVRQIVRLEGLVVFFASLYFYYLFGASWILFLLLILAPDLSMVGYLRDKKIGALTYNIVHNYILAAAFIAWGVYFESSIVLSLGLILSAHIGFDRFLGFGLKYPTAFKDSHLQRL
jgi:hypothetical protein